LAGVALLVAAGIAWALGYRGGGHTPAETQAVTTTAPTTTTPTPGIGNAQALQVSPYGATIAWTTAEPSTASLRFGPAGLKAVLWATAPVLDTAHRVALRGLAASTTYRVSLTGTSSERQTTRATLSFTTLPAPAQAAGSIVNGVLRVNGEPFFPLLSWQQCPDQWPPSVAAGINLVAVGSPCASPAAALTTLQGRALVAAADGTSAAGAPVLGSFYPDEADARGLSGSSLPALPAGIRFLTLTSHFASGAAPLPSGRGMYPGLIAAADVVGFDLYPLQELCRRDLLPLVFDAQRDLEALAPGKPTFQWIEVRGMRCPTPASAAITPGTIRAESWLAIAAGAHGLGFFPPDWDYDAFPVIAALAARIRQLEPALLEPVVPVQTDGSAGVRATARTYNGAEYVIAVNGGATTADVRFTLPDLGDRTLMVLGGPTTLKAHSGTFTDRLAPLRVRIYVAPPA
jgi:hypothetical protein